MDAFHSNKALLVENRLRLYGGTASVLRWAGEENWRVRLLVCSGDRHFSRFEASPCTFLISLISTDTRIKGGANRICLAPPRTPYLIPVTIADFARLAIPCTRSRLVVIYFAFTCETCFISVWHGPCTGMIIDKCVSIPFPCVPACLCQEAGPPAAPVASPDISARSPAFAPNLACTLPLRRSPSLTIHYALGIRARAHKRMQTGSFGSMPH
jgi:hypothetical protein